MSRSRITAIDIDQLKEKIDAMNTYYIEVIKTERMKGIKGVARKFVGLFSEEASNPVKNYEKSKSLADSAKNKNVEIIQNFVEYSPAEHKYESTITLTTSQKYIPVTETVNEVQRVTNSSMQEQKVKGSQDVRPIKNEDALKKQIAELEGKPKLSSIQEKQLEMLRGSLKKTEVDIHVERIVTKQVLRTTVNEREQRDIMYKHEVYGRNKQDNAIEVFIDLVNTLETNFYDLFRETLENDFDRPDKNKILLEKLNGSKRDHHSLRMHALILKNIFSDERLMKVICNSDNAYTERRIALLSDVLNVIDVSDLHYPIIDNTLNNNKKMS